MKLVKPMKLSNKWSVFLKIIVNSSKMKIFLTKNNEENKIFTSIYVNGHYIYLSFLLGILINI